MSKIIYAVYTGEYEDVYLVDPLYTNKSEAEKALEAYKKRDKEEERWIEEYWIVEHELEEAYKEEV